MIKVGYCVAYDWQLLRHSIPAVYDHCDSICLSIDKNRQNWAGQYFSWDEVGFKQMVSEIDTRKKIKIYEDVFYNPALLPMQNEVAQRKKISEFLGKGGWHIQLDTDEYFLDFDGFVSYLNKIVPGRKVNICCPMINLYKQIPEGMLWIKPSSFKEIEYFPIASLYPDYQHGRRNGHFNILTDFSILHQSWARGENEIWEKLNSWGHAKDFDVPKYFGLWKNANVENYSSYKNFHHLRGDAWPALELKKNMSIENMFNFANEDFSLPIEKRDLRKINSIWLSRARKVLNILSGK